MYFQVSISSSICASTFLTAVKVSEVGPIINPARFLILIFKLIDFLIPKVFKVQSSGKIKDQFDPARFCLEFGAIADPLFLLRKLKQLLLFLVRFAAIFLVITNNWLLLRFIFRTTFGTPLHVVQSKKVHETPPSGFFSES